MNAATPQWAIRPLTPEAVYTDRQEHIEYLYQMALKAITRRAWSTVLLGQRRMGKTEIFKRVVNRLFFEQEHYADPAASVVPVYYSFKDMVADRWEFSCKYIENFVRWYAAFRLRRPEIIDAQRWPTPDLFDLVREQVPETGNFKNALRLHAVLADRGMTYPEERALMLPRSVADRDESTVVVFLDEFQNTRLPQYDFGVVSYLREASESPTCPHIFSNAISGRFDSQRIKPLTDYWGAELAAKAAAYYGAILPDAMAPLVANRCGGNPFYVTAVVRRAALQQKSLADEERLNEILAVDLSSGFIWGELNDQVTRWIERINEYGVTKWVLYLSALGDDPKIEPEQIRQELWERDRRDVPLATIRDTLIKLSRGDLLEYAEFGNWFRKTDDPILLDFLRVWGRIEVESESAETVQKDLVRRYRALERRVADQLGYLAEIYMAQVLWNGQDRTLPGRWFHSAADVTLPWRFIYIWHRTRLVLSEVEGLGAGAGMELDLEAAAGQEHWIGESKWQADRKVGRAEVETLLHKAERVREKEGPLLKTLRVWFFSHAGFTAEAEALMQEQGVYWSTAADLDALLELVGLRRLPAV